MNRTIKDATVKRLHYASHDQLRQHLIDFVTAYDPRRTSSSTSAGRKSPEGSPSAHSTKCRD
jgi:hypothetical protein